jgi:hypothetical protein
MRILTADERGLQRIAEARVADGNYLCQKRQAQNLDPSTSLAFSSLRFGMTTTTALSLDCARLQLAPHRDEQKPAVSYQPSAVSQFKSLNRRERREMHYPSTPLAFSSLRSFGMTSVTAALLPNTNGLQF